MALSRISLTIARSLVSALDKKARELDRSRSWVIVEAVRRFLEGADIPTKQPAIVREAGAPYLVSPGLGESRRRQLEADLKLTPTERVRLAQQTADLGRKMRRGTRGPDRVLTFERYEDYLDWQRREGLLT